MVLQELLPDGSGLRVKQIELNNADVDVDLKVTRLQANCGSACHRVRALYQWTIHDQPCLGRQIVYRVTPRKFRCDNYECQTRVFCERMPELISPFSRTTTSLTGSHRAIGEPIGGADQSGHAAAANALDPSASRSTTALRRDRRLCNQERSALWHNRNRPRTQLCTRLAAGSKWAALEAWLDANPHVEVVTRDHWAVYATAIRASAP